MMPKDQKKLKFYAVKVGREGPKIYNSWDNCKAMVSRYPGSIHKSFTSQKEAEEWLQMSSQQLAPAHSSEPTNDLANIAEDVTGKGKPVASVDVSLGVPLRNNSARASNAVLGPQAVAAGPASSNIVLAPEQKAVLEKVRQGKSVFFTGSAGTGKSVLLREIINMRGGASKSLGVTASTGMAAISIGGTTLHSWAGIGLGQESSKSLAGKIAGQKTKVLDRWRDVRTLIIDEISMIDGILFDKLEDIARRLRRNNLAFGGIQLVLSGDFCQLPPVSPYRDGVQVPPTFAFEAECWETCVGRPITLTRVFRQKDQAFVDMLNNLRLGHLDQKTIEAFQNLSRPVIYDDDIEPTELFSTRREVDTANSTRLKHLPDRAVVYKSMDIPGYDSNGVRMTGERTEKLLERLVATKILTLKVGAQVMLIKNLVQGELVNGSVGQVVAFSSSQEALKNHTEIARTDDVQLREASAESTSRPSHRSLDVLSDRFWPVVRFTNGRTMLCVPAEFSVNNAQGEIEARRDQIPLILAWALSVHKSQGQTLERVKVDLRHTFEKGQAYVALSRVTSMQGLQVLGFNATKVMAHPRVLVWSTGIDQDSGMYYNDDEMDNEEAMAAYYA